MKELRFLVSLDLAYNFFMIINLLLVSLITFSALAVTVSLRVFQIRAGKEFTVNPTLYSIAEPKVENSFIA